MAYSKKRAAASLGISKKEFEKRAKEAGFDSTEAYWDSIGGDMAPFEQAMIKDILAFNRQIDEVSRYISFTEEEDQSFTDRAIEEIMPYYDSKKAEIEEGIKEGKLQTAEDILSTIREVEAQTKSTLAKWDLTQAANEEEFIDKLADLTATTAEDLAYKKQDFKQRLEDTKFDLIQKGTLTGGTGRRIMREERESQALEEQALTRRAEAKETALERGKKYDLEAVQLARQDAEQKRIRLIGSPEEAAAAEAEARERTGYGVEGLPSEMGITRAREERDIEPLDYREAKLTELERKRVADVETTKLELEKAERTRREEENRLIREGLERKRTQTSSLLGR